MRRLRVPGGVLRAEQMLGLAEMAESWGNQRLDLTTRSNVQLREFQPRDIVRVLGRVGALGMTSRGSGADNVRNITASPITGLDATELMDVGPLAEALQQYLTNSRDLYDLPRKFNVAFDSGGAGSVLADTNDIGFVAVEVKSGRSVPPGVYFRVLLCGITGHRQFASDSGLLLRADQTVAVAAAMIRVFVQHGDRTDRKKARLKYLVDRWGIATFVEETEKLLAFPLIRVAADECEPRRPVDRMAHLGVHAQKEAGKHYLGVVVPVGQLPVLQSRAVAEVARRFGSGEIRLTVWQNLLIPDIAAEELAPAIETLRDAGLRLEAGTVLSGTVACTGNKGCRFAATDTKTHAVALADLLDSRFPRESASGIHEPVNVHVPGCHNSCAQHYVGDVGLMGIKVGGEEGYQVLLGGGADHEQGLGRELFPALTYVEVQGRLVALFEEYTAQRQYGEAFLAFARRHSVEELRAMCNSGESK